MLEFVEAFEITPLKKLNMKFSKHFWNCIDILMHEIPYDFSADIFDEATASLHA